MTPRPAFARLRRSALLPLLLLSLQLAAVCALRGREHGFRPIHRPDTAGYLQLAELTDPGKALSHYRTLGYPLFVRLVGGGRVDTARMPSAQFALYAAAVLVLWLGLSRYTGSAWWALAGATTLPWAGVVDQAAEIMTDFTTAAVTVLVFGLLLWLAARPRSPALWVALGLSTFVAYQMRPAALVLLLWVPLAAAILRLCRERQRPAALLRWAGGIVLLTALPYLLFAAFRLIVVGHFGLVSFGGNSLAGVAACLLDEEVVRELPDEHRPLARSILRQRRRRGWRPLTLDSDPLEAAGQFSDNMWKISLPAANAQLRGQRRRLAARGLEPQDRRSLRVRRNEILGRLARAILRARPRLYLRWVGRSFRHGLAALVARSWIAWPLSLLALSAPLLALRLRVARRAGRIAAAERAVPRRLLAILAVSLLYSLLYLASVSLISWPAGRYLDAIALFPPVALTMALCPVWRRILWPADASAPGARAVTS